MKVIKSSGEKAAAVVKYFVIVLRSGIISGERINLNETMKMFIGSSENRKIIANSLDESLYHTFGSIINVHNAIVNCIREIIIPVKKMPQCIHSIRDCHSQDGSPFKDSISN